MRTRQYAVERERRELEQSSGSIEDYLRSLEMIGETRPIDETELQRVVQLLAKTNQFNLTTRRHSRDEVVSLLGTPGAIGMTIRVRDRFGDHGLIGVMIGVPEPGHEVPSFRIDTWLMSCRVIGRTVEQFTFGELLDRAARLGYRRIIGEYLPTPKNELVRELYQSLGFESAGESSGGRGSFYHFDVFGGRSPTTFVAAGSPAG